MRKDRRGLPVACGYDVPHDLADTILVKRAVPFAESEQLRRLAFRLPANRHCLRRYLLCGLLSQPALVFGSENLPRHDRGGPNDKPANLTFQFAEHALVVLRGGLTCFCRDLLSRENCFLSFLLEQASS